MTAEEYRQQQLAAKAAAAGQTAAPGQTAPVTAGAPLSPAGLPIPRPMTPTPPSGYGDSWKDVIPGTSGYGKPARPGNQSWFDWFSKSYTPTPQDAATVAADAASYGLAPRALQGMQALKTGGLGTAMPIPKGETPDVMRSQIADAYNRMGPFGPIAQAFGYAASPLTYTGVGLTGKVLARGAEALPEASSLVAPYAPKLARFLPEGTFPQAVQGGNFAGAASAGKTYGSGGSPLQAGESYAESFPTGAGLSVAAGALPMGARTPAQVTQSTQATLDALGNPIIPRKNLGFAISSGPGQFRGDPTLADVEAIKKMLLTEATPKGYTPPTPSATGTAQTGYRSQYDTQPGPETPGYGRGPSPTTADASRDATVGSPELQQNVRPPSAAGGTIQDILLNKIANALPQSLDANYQQAMQQAQNAQKLQLMRSNAGLPGFDVRGEAAEAAQNYPPLSAENTAFQNIARVPDAVPKTVTPGARRAMIYGAGALGEGAGWLGGIPGVGATTSAIGNEAANAIDWAFSPKSPTHAIQQTIDQQYQPLTGQSVGPGGNSALLNALLYLRSPGTGSQ